ncbi:hypothetical protein [Agrobacterium larrymoorei]|uniref:Uncharacterized protein n=1 Tax=Agrobacterium larrymoorei TaxID=160699 RepID=A0ABU0UF86_9HYPH|nr:hypothetical protein [Agrobacterium larrymoorei]MDQ1183601.1 hypothetical protein [Agrobacterium larrymoorei]
MDTIYARRKHYEERLAAALRQLNDAIRDVHKSGLDVDISTVVMHTQRGPMLQVDLYTYRLEGFPPILSVATDETPQF